MLEQDENIFDRNKKKKSKKQIKSDVSEETKLTPITTDNIIEQTNDENCDYTYDELLCRVFEKLPKRSDDPRSVHILLPPMRLGRIGTRRTVLVNFGVLCSLLHRSENLVLQYFISELGSQASIDVNHGLVVRGRFQSSHFETVLRRFIKEYVICKACHSNNTILRKSDRLIMLYCNECLTQYSVITIRRAGLISKN